MTHPSSGEKLYDQNLTQWLQLSGEYIGRVRPVTSVLPGWSFCSTRFVPLSRLRNTTSSWGNCRLRSVSAGLSTARRS